MARTATRRRRRRTITTIRVLPAPTLRMSPERINTPSWPKSAMRTAARQKANCLTSTCCRCTPTPPNSSTGRTPRPSSITIPIPPSTKNIATRSARCSRSPTSAPTSIRSTGRKAGGPPTKSTASQSTSLRVRRVNTARRSGAASKRSPGRRASERPRKRNSAGSPTACSPSAARACCAGPMPATSRSSRRWFRCKANVKMPGTMPRRFSRKSRSSPTPLRATRIWAR
ncbi:MAG: hypothetical protein BWX70_03401 [Verrucomicrobia bacterium ADurb.Bin070]|nr:MAG: hypothetical protein BWX70_03401 [Verrucomicrobia bacterium ADurb.Bin070]